MTYTEYLLVSAVCFCVSFVIFHIVFVRWYLSKRPQLSAQVTYFWFFIVYFLSGLVAFNLYYLVYFAFEATDFFAIICIFCILNIGFCYSYFHVYNMSQTATRIKIMVDLLSVEQRDEHVPLNEPIEVRMIENRIDRLEKMKQIAEDDAGVVYVISGKFLFIGKILGLFGKGIAGKNIY